MCMRQSGARDLYKTLETKKCKDRPCVPEVATIVFYINRNPVLILKLKKKRFVVNGM